MSPEIDPTPYESPFVLRKVLSVKLAEYICYRFSEEELGRPNPAPDFEPIEELFEVYKDFEMPRVTTYYDEEDDFFGHALMFSSLEEDQEGRAQIRAIYFKVSLDSSELVQDPLTMECKIDAEDSSILYDDSGTADSDDYRSILKLFDPTTPINVDSKVTSILLELNLTDLARMFPGGESGKNSIKDLKSYLESLFDQTEDEVDPEFTNSMVRFVEISDPANPDPQYLIIEKTEGEFTVTEFDKLAAEWVTYGVEEYAAASSGYTNYDLPEEKIFEIREKIKKGSVLSGQNASRVEEDYLMARFSGDYSVAA